MADPRHRLGLEAEAVVAAQLVSAGWLVLARRHRAADGELDLVCLDPGMVLVGVEVRARRSARSGSAIESVDRRKVARLRAGLMAYATRERPRYRGIRLDLVTVERAEIGWRMVRHEGIDAW
jgi:putative endonuclease